MDLCIIAEVDWQSYLTSTWWFTKAALGLGFVIFVHELGHFLVAKMCGVKCEKFYVGFDVPMPKIGPIQIPSRFCRFQWGETEYGIGVIPLGGYVKMLGQDDDPRNAQAEAERIRLHKKAEEADAAGARAAAGPGETDEAAARSDTEAAGEPDDFELDPRSFPAKSVPKRMAIISAGVIMNLIFAVIFAAVAFRLGLPYITCDVGATSPGSPAWLAGLPEGSKIIQIGRQGQPSEKLRFDWDLSNAGVGLAQDQEDLALLVRTEDGTEKWYEIRPTMAYDELGVRPLLGIAPQQTMEIAQIVKKTSAGSTSLAAGDVVQSINGQSVHSYGDVVQLMSQARNEPVVLEVLRPDKRDRDKAPGRHRITVPPNPLLRLGLQMEAGPIVGIQPGSPADQAGLEVGDRLLSIADRPVQDIMLLPDMVHPYYGQEVDIEVERRAEGETERLRIPITPRVPSAYDWQVSSGIPFGVDALGIAVEVGLEVTGVAEGTPAAEHGLQVGDEVAAVQFLGKEENSKTIVLESNEYDWLFVFDMLQSVEPETTIKLTYIRGNATRSVALKPVASTVNQSHRGIYFKRKRETYVAESWSEALAVGVRQTGEDISRVGLFLKKLVTGGISATNLGGPLTIVYVAGKEASGGLPKLLIFFTFLSANLAVLNFLPIPALDGGHMLFLLAEGILRRRIDEGLQTALTLVGVLCLLTLMVFVFGLDIHRFFFS